jgi:hypothetical protein
MVTNSFENRKFHVANGKVHHAFMMGFIFPFVAKVGGVIFCFCLPCSQCVPSMLSSCFLEVLQVPKLFPKTFLIALQFYPMWFAQSSTLMYINWKGRLLGNTFVSILQLGVQRNASIGGVFDAPKKLPMGQWIWLFQKTNKKLWAHPRINNLPRFI